MLRVIIGFTAVYVCSQRNWVTAVPVMVWENGAYWLLSCGISSPCPGLFFLALQANKSDHKSASSRLWWCGVLWWIALNSHAWMHVVHHRFPSSHVWAPLIWNQVWPLPFDFSCRRQCCRSSWPSSPSQWTLNPRYKPSPAALTLSWVTRATALNRMWGRTVPTVASVRTPSIWGESEGGREITRFCLPSFQVVWEQDLV